MTFRISNRDARRLWLDVQGLAAAPAGPLDPLAIVRSLGFVQLDTIQNVTRAHHHILWSRDRRYREPMLDRMLRARTIFEHFTHDASVLPVEFFPFWRRRFAQLEAKVRSWEWHRGMLDDEGRVAIKARIAAEGPLSTRAFDTKLEGERAMWRRVPHKLALDYMWYAGELATSHRDHFVKHYDLIERVIPEAIRADVRRDGDQVDWLCSAALGRLGFATPGDIQRFWAAVTPAEVKAWVESHRAALMEVEIESHDGKWSRALAPAGIEALLAAAAAPSATRLRLLSPFDPAIRDRARLKRLFGFDYTIEIFVPAAKRRWGYYVYPLLEGDRFVGRAELKADRKAATVELARLWPERGIRWTAARQKRLAAELARLESFLAGSQRSRTLR